MKLENGVDTSLWPEQPYQWIANDLNAAIEGRANHLVALGLLCYTEYMGREALSFLDTSKGFQNINNAKAFNFFLGEYIGYKALLKQYNSDVYKWFRNGIAHEYRFKARRVSGVYDSFEPNSEEEFKKRGVDTSVGLVIRAIRDETAGEAANRVASLPFSEKKGTFKEDLFPYKKVPQCLFLITTIYFNDFCYGIQRFLNESNQISQNIQN